MGGTLSAHMYRWSMMVVLKLGRGKGPKIWGKGLRPGQAGKGPKYWEKARGSREGPKDWEKSVASGE
jgi:hypothetical protein